MNLTISRSTDIIDIEEEKKHFRLNAKQLLLIYKHCPIAKEEAFRLLGNKNNLVIQKYIIAEERNQYGAPPNLHCYIICDKKVDIKKYDYFDLEGYHGDYQSCSNKNLVQSYCIKEENNYITNMDVKPTRKKYAPNEETETVTETTTVKKITRRKRRKRSSYESPNNSNSSQDQYLSSSHKRIHISSNQNNNNKIIVPVNLFQAINLSPIIGYPQHLFPKEKNSLLQHFICFLCNGVIRDPVFSGCSNADFTCSSCLQQYVEKHQNGEMECPKCQEIITIKDNAMCMKSHPQMMQMSGQMLLVQCQQIDKDTNGKCMNEMKLNEYEQHLSICSLVPVQCPLCYEPSIPRKDLKTHELQNCRKQMVACSLACGRNLLREEIKKHENEECPNFIISCEWCKEMIQRKVIQKHYEEQCEKFEIYCENKDKGCEIKMNKKNAMKDHLLKNCIYRMMKCPWGCQEDIMLLDLETHLLNVNKAEHLTFKIASLNKQSKQLQKPKT